jgi:hypothetical protein
LLSITDLCAIYIYLLFFCVPPKLHIYTRSVQCDFYATCPHRYHEN